MVAALQALVTALLSTSEGLAFLLSAQHAAAEVAVALHPGSDAAVAALLQQDSNGHGLQQQQQPSLPVAPAERLAQGLLLGITAARAAAALAAPVDGGDGSPGPVGPTAATQTLVQLMTLYIGRHIVVHALACTAGALPFLLTLMRRHAAILRSQTAQRARASKHEEAFLLGGADSASSASLQPQHVHASFLLHCVISSPHPQMLKHWLPLAVDMHNAADAELAARVAAQPKIKEDKCRRCRMLKEIKGISVSGHVMQRGSLPGVLQQLTGLLPKALGGDQGTAGNLLRERLQLLRSPERIGELLCALNLLVAQLQAACEAAPPSNASSASAAAAAATAAAGDTEANRLAALRTSQLVSQLHASDGLCLLESALHCGVLGLTASQSDISWVARLGDAIDTVDRIRGRAHAVALVTSALKGLEHAFRLFSGQKLHAAGCLQALIAAHAAIVLSPESMLGAAALPTGIPELLKLRPTVVALLSVWMENEWSPDVVQTMFKMRKDSNASIAAAAAETAAAGLPIPPTPHFVDPNLTPQECYAGMTLLADLMPSEWPPALALKGAVAAGPPPPPSQMRRRTALALAFEPCTDFLRRLVAFGAGCEVRIVRCALMRLCSKAVGAFTHACKRTWQ